MLFKYLLFLIIVSKCANSSKILAIFWTPIQSHHNAGVPLLQALARKGHTVHLMSTFQDKVNISTYKQGRLAGIFDFSSDDFEPDSPGAFINHVYNKPDEIKRKAENFWKNKLIQNVVRTKRKYDVVICLAHHTDHIFPIAHHIGAPLILFAPFSTNILENKYVGNPTLPFYTPPTVEETPENFSGRFFFFIYNVMTTIIDKFFLRSLHEKITRIHLPNAPPLSQLNVSLILVNSHYLIESPRPYVPNMIPIGGYHLHEPDGPLQEKYREFLDSATKGAVVFSMGTNLNVGTFLDVPTLMETFKGLNSLKFLFKSDVPIPSAPENVMVVSWIESQVDVLAHPNVKVFITHGGLDGIIEAVYHAVPIIGIPSTGEQKSNINHAVKCGHTIRLNAADITPDELSTSISTIIKKPIYAKNAKKRSLLLKKRPIDSMTLAIWWVEHIIAHKGGEHLKNVGATLAWYNLYMIDVIYFYVMIAVTTALSYLCGVRYLRPKRPVTQKDPLSTREPALPGKSAPPRGPALSPRCSPESPKGPTESPSGSAESPSGSAESPRGLIESPSGSTESPSGPPGSPTVPIASEEEEGEENPGTSDGASASKGPKNAPKKKGRKRR